LGVEALEDGRWKEVRRYSGTVAHRSPRARAAATLLDPPAIPGWAREQAPIEARPPKPLAPSAILADDEPLTPPSAAMRAAARRGTLIHQLLERLVAVAPGNRAAAAGNWLERSGGVSEAADRDEIVSQVCAILADPRFAALFGPDSLGEAPLAATLADGRVIAGTVDRLLVEAGRISVIDFKTGRVPQGEAAIPASHRAQMAAYVEALEVIFPGREIRAALLYTGGPTLFELAA
ncbi:MAG: PD-(D/E)XK nuclease family protein, partial [Sphingomicrobium sp.]